MVYDINDFPEESHTDMSIGRSRSTKWINVQYIFEEGLELMKRVSGTLSVFIIKKMRQICKMLRHYVYIEVPPTRY